MKAYLLADPKHTELNVTPTDTGVSIAHPPADTDPIASFVCFDTKPPWQTP